MTLERIQETPALKGAPLSPLLRSLSGTLCMISQQRSVSHRTSKYSSNRHRKLQPFRET
ncbi:AAEL000160-PA [Aedes aegypti]|uniref:AAEL000160-PA n=1 Tax=Aedes aegypti TaxID=7159 RepID=Q17PW0_AEDAE|nr:AAEL000160-PA [Aedes aegypti]